MDGGDRIEQLLIRFFLLFKHPYLREEICAGDGLPDKTSRRERFYLVAKLFQLILRQNESYISILFRRRERVHSSAKTANGQLDALGFFIRLTGQYLGAVVGFHEFASICDRDSNWLGTRVIVGVNHIVACDAFF